MNNERTLVDRGFDYCPEAVIPENELDLTNRTKDRCGRCRTSPAAQSFTRRGDVSKQSNVRPSDARRTHVSREASCCPRKTLTKGTVVLGLCYHEQRPFPQKTGTRHSRPGIECSATMERAALRVISLTGPCVRNAVDEPLGRRRHWPGSIGLQQGSS